MPERNLEKLSILHKFHQESSCPRIPKFYQSFLLNSVQWIVPSDQQIDLYQDYFSNHIQHICIQFYFFQFYEFLTFLSPVKFRIRSLTISVRGFRGLKCFISNPLAPSTLLPTLFEDIIII